MKITITGSPKEIAALVDELQERRELNEARKLISRLEEELQGTFPQPGSEDRSFSLPIGTP